MSYKELKQKGILALKKIAKELGIETKEFKSDNKDKLALKIARKQAAMDKKSGSKKSKSSKKGRTPTKKSRSPKAASSCSPMSDSKCKSIKKDELAKIARKCGIDVGKKTKSELCSEISKSSKKSKTKTSKKSSKKSKSSTKSPKSSTKSADKDLGKMTKKELQDLARKHKIVGFSQLNKGPLIDLIKKKLKSADKPKSRDKSATKTSTKKSRTPSKKSSKKSRTPTPAPRTPPTPAPRTPPTPAPRTPPTPAPRTPPTPAPRTPPKKPSRPASSEPAECNEKYLSKSVGELKELLQKKGHKIWGGKKEGKKNQIIDYLCAIENELTCDPLLGKDCEGNLICDVTNDRNVCVSPKVADERVGDRGLVEMEYNGKRIIGSATAIKALKERIAEAFGDDEPPSDEFDLDDEPPSDEFDLDDEPPSDEFDLDDEPPSDEFEEEEKIVIDSPDERYDQDVDEEFDLPDEPEVDKTDIEEVLRRVQEAPGDQDLDDLSMVEREVMKCLGLLAR